MYIKNPSVLFSHDQIQKIEDVKKAKYVCATEHQGRTVEVFYSDEAHPVSNSRYFALYKTHLTDELMITDGSFVEKQDIDAVIADDGDIIYSRYRHDYMVSNDKSVWIDGGRAYTRSGVYPKERHVKLAIRNGVFEIKNAG